MVSGHGSPKEGPLGCAVCQAWREVVDTRRVEQSTRKALRGAARAWEVRGGSERSFWLWLPAALPPCDEGEDTCP